MLTLEENKLRLIFYMRFPVCLHRTNNSPTWIDQLAAALLFQRSASHQPNLSLRRQVQIPKPQWLDPAINHKNSTSASSARQPRTDPHNKTQIRHTHTEQRRVTNSHKHFNLRNFQSTPNTPLKKNIRASLSITSTISLIFPSQISQISSSRLPSLSISPITIEHMVLLVFESTFDLAFKTARVWLRVGGDYICGGLVLKCGLEREVLGFLIQRRACVRVSDRGGRRG
ncbi:hypothetical protein Droror1_Dr00014833 [Drosera rotundifolia]